MEEELMTLDWNEHIRRRAEMYLGMIGDGGSEDGIYTLMKGVLESFLVEYEMGFCKDIWIEYNNQMVSIREYGRGIPLKSIVSSTSGISVGIGASKNVVTANGIKIANALSESFLCYSYRDGMHSWVSYEKGYLKEQRIEEDNEEEEPNGTWIQFEFDKELFPGSEYREDIVHDIVKRYTEEYPGLSITLRFIASS